MNTKEIAQAVNKDVTTVQRWIKRLNGKMQSIDGKMQSSTSTNPADFNLEETCQIIEIGLGKNAAGMYRMNAKESTVIPTGSSLTQKDLDIISSIMGMVMAKLDKRVEAIESRIETRQALLPAPQVSPRTHVTQIVRAYAVDVDREIRGVYTDLYREFGYRTNTSPALCAKNRGMPTMDYIEAEGMIETLEAVALDYLK